MRSVVVVEHIVHLCQIRLIPEQVQKGDLQVNCRSRNHIKVYFDRKKLVLFVQ